MSAVLYTCCIITRTFYKLEFIKREKFMKKMIVQLMFS